MRTGCFLLAMVLASSLSCGRDTVATLTSLSDDTVLVAEDRETMERIIDCAVAGECGRLSVMALLAEQKVFRVPSGTTVRLHDGFSFSKVRNIRVLDGAYAGRDGWVHERMLTLTSGSEDPTTPITYSPDVGFASVFLDTYQ